MKTKIVITAGPASRSAETLAALVEAGVDCVRLNFSHGSHDEHAAVVSRLRQIEAETGAAIAVMGDLCGPKLRTGAISEHDRELLAGERVEIVAAPADGNAHRFGTNSPELILQARVGDRVLIDDGQIRLRVTAQEADRLVCACEVGGTLGSHKGVNLPDTPLDMPPLTAKDRADLDFAVRHELDYVALSFVRQSADVLALRDELQNRGADLHIISKIETPQAVRDIDAIIAASDAVLVARGDLGVEMDLAAVPLVQKDIARRCRAAHKPVIIATQMLQSMIVAPTPTRAEVSDVANAILDDADAVMLSAETAVGRYPREAVDVIRSVAEQTERFRDAADDALHEIPPHRGHSDAGDEPSLRESIAAGAAWLANAVRPAVVAVWTLSGSTARRVSKQRVTAPVLGLAPDERVARRLALYYGVVPLVMRRPVSDAAMIAAIEQRAAREGWAQPGEMIVIVAGSSEATGHSSHAIFLHRVQTDGV